MNTPSVEHSLVATFALAAAIVLPPLSQALAGDWLIIESTSVYDLGDGDTATVQGGGAAVNDAMATTEAGDRLADGTIYAGNDFAAMQADADALHTWAEAKRYCAALQANGHNDWTLPTRHELDRLYQNKNAGAFAGTFNDSADGSTSVHWYWSSEEHATHSSFAWFQSFTDGDGNWYRKDVIELSVRCVRDANPVGAEMRVGEQRARGAPKP